MTDQNSLIDRLNLLNKQFDLLVLKVTQLELERHSDQREIADVKTSIDLTKTTVISINKELESVADILTD